MKLCACGCGQEITRKPRPDRLNLYIHGHHPRGKPRSEETKIKIGLANKGRKWSVKLRKLWSENKKRRYASGELTPYWLGRKDKPGWNRGGGREKFIDARGYVVVRSRRKVGKRYYILEHRKIMEEHIGRSLESQEVVHHIDEDTTNNEISNLMLFPNNAAHKRFHKIKKAVR